MHRHIQYHLTSVHSTPDTTITMLFTLCSIILQLFLGKALRRLSAALSKGILLKKCPPASSLTTPILAQIMANKIISKTIDSSNEMS